MFAAQFDGGRRGRFSYLIRSDQGRIPFGSFTLNGGEKGADLRVRRGGCTSLKSGWRSTRSPTTRAKPVEYSDVNDVVDITHYKMTVDLRDFREQMGLVARMEHEECARRQSSAIPFQIGESCGVYRRTCG